MLDLESLLKYSKKLTVLYVEDNLDAMESTLLILEDFFNIVIVAYDGVEGLEKFKNSQIDLVITDINMPNLSGLDMIRKIKKIDKNISTLVLSAYDESQYFREGIKLGIDGYLLKPIDTTQFMDILDKTIQKIKLEEESRKNIYLLAQYQEVADRSSIVSKSDLKGNITYVNDSFCEISEYSREELIGSNYSPVRHPDNSPLIYQDLWDTIKKKKMIWQGIIRNISKSGNSYYVKTTIKPILNKEGEILEYISLRNDITDIMSPKKQLQDLVDSFDEAVVILMKIERFDDIEKFYGSKISENIEINFSQEILKKIPKECGFHKIFKLGEGEYSFVKNRENCHLGIPKVIQNLQELQSNIFNTEMNLEEIDYDTSILISLAYGKDALENARYGLKQILETKQDFIVANDLVQKEREDSKKNLETLKMVKRAIDDFKIISYFQPIINNKTKEIEKYESLVRLIDEDDNVISPFFFLDTTKKGKYYSQITEMVLENSFSALKHTDMDISINLSILDIEKKLTREKIFTLLNANKENLNRVVFELLEDEDVKDFKLIRSFIDKVKSMGVKIAIDDFGSGYSSFERLLDYQPDILKIDGSLVRNIVDNNFSLNVVETIVAFAKKQNIKVIAEYVENENIYNILKSIGVDYSQGYYFGKPQELI